MQQQIYVQLLLILSHAIQWKQNKYHDKSTRHALLVQLETKLADWLKGFVYCPVKKMLS